MTSEAPLPLAEPGSPADPATATQAAARSKGDADSRSSRLVIVVLLAILAAAGAGVFVVAVLPRWWAHRVGDAADGRFATAIWFGLSVGVACTAAPLVVWARAFGARRHQPDPQRPRKGWGGRTWRARLLYGVTGLVLAAPNLLTLGIQLGNGKAAHAADRTLDVEAPGFRGASLAGALTGLVLTVTFGVLVRSRRSRGEELRRVKAELEEARGGSGREGSGREGSGREGSGADRTEG